MSGEISKKLKAKIKKNEKWEWIKDRNSLSIENKIISGSNFLNYAKIEIVFVENWQTGIVGQEGVIDSDQCSDWTNSTLSTFWWCI